MSGTPKPVVATGTYLVDIASLTVDPKTKRATISNPKYNVEATFTPYHSTCRSDKKVQDFTFKDPQTKKNLTGSYDYSWGNKSVNGFIIGNGSGGYYIITSAMPGSSSSTIDGATLLDPGKAQYSYSYDHSKDWSSGNFFDLQLNGEHYYFHQDNDGTATDGSLDNEQFTFNTCFLAGSLIRTPSGYRKVEELKRGDVVITYDPVKNQTFPQVLTWAGRSRVWVRPSLPLDMAGYPVRIRKDALAKNVPSEDLLITAEHCLFLDGCFVPARMLVNGRSIHYETADACQTVYDIFHVETENHSIIFANNAMTESYLDTGNRNQFIRHSNDNGPDNK
ncbi:Hint domain-containing protein [Bombella sp. TMW 2.2559]|uniref:Hint domain-containing protein n=1 Tax=Bombella dulcis TaxID=2967339 RepID=A0ABT3WAZ5_9PROT|nr:Hint domain-containing protein [Bombella dulcis]MCX5616265.1 Hint domain-containing protein [Bombella dulcis]